MYALDLAVGHIGTSVPLLLIFLVVDQARPRWWVPVVTALLLAWVLVADPVVGIAGVAPLALVSVTRAIRGRSASSTSTPAGPERPFLARPKSAQD